MFENYKATEKDFESIEEGIKTVWRPELDFIFSQKNFLKNIAVISYDSSFIYLWTDKSIPNLTSLPCSLSNYYAYKIPHKVKIKDDWHHAWWTGSLPDLLERILSVELKTTWNQISKIYGGLMTSFIELQKKKDLGFNPYITKQSYLATIIHEFGHAYWEKHKLWWYSDKKENLDFLETAKKLYERRKVKKNIYFPMVFAVGELFAFCAEYAACEILWKNHKLNMDKFIKERLKILIKEEQKKNLDREDSVLAPTRYSHDFAFVFGKIILSNYPETWPKILT